MECQLNELIQIILFAWLIKDWIGRLSDYYEHSTQQKTGRNRSQPDKAHK